MCWREHLLSTGSFIKVFATLIAQALINWLLHELSPSHCIFFIRIQAPINHWVFLWTEHINLEIIWWIRYHWWQGQTFKILAYVNTENVQCISSWTMISQKFMCNIYKIWVCLTRLKCPHFFVITVYYQFPASTTEKFWRMPAKSP